jgi:hypothetical protein
MHACNICQSVLKNQVAAVKHVKRRHPAEFDLNDQNTEILISRVEFDES